MGTNTQWITAMPTWWPTTSESLLVALGGGGGAFARLMLSRGLLAINVVTPWPTAVINLLGSIVLGMVMIACRDRPSLLILLGTGFCGGFTTFSTFGVEMARLLNEGRFGLATGYMLISLVGATTGAMLGSWLAGRGS